MSPSPRAVVLAAKIRLDVAQGACSPMAPLLDRAFLQHVVERLVDRGFKRIDLLLHEEAQWVESVLGNGERLGAKFTHHLVRDPQRPYARLAKLLHAEPNEPVLVTHADLLEVDAWDAYRPTGGDAVVLCHEVAGRIESGGSAWITPGVHLPRLPLEGQREDWDAALMTLATRVVTRRPLSCRSFREFLNSQRRVLDGELPELNRHPSCEPGVWVRRNVSLHPSVELRPPVFIDSDSLIEEHAKLGPHVVVGAGCHLCRGVEATNASFLPESMTGEGLSLEQCVQDRHSLFHVGNDVALSVDDELLIGSTRMPAVSWPARWFGRAAALIMAVATWPLLCAARAYYRTKHGATWTVEEFVRLPLPNGLKGRRPPTFRLARINEVGPAVRTNWRHFLQQFLPGLWSVARGDLAWVGVAPLTPAQLAELPDHWRDLYVECASGLVNASATVFGQVGHPEELLAAEAYFAVSRSNWAKLACLAQYARSLFLGPLAGRFRDQPPAIAARVLHGIAAVREGVES